MESDPFAMALSALAIVLDPTRILFLLAGVLMGLVLGIIPGIGGLVGLSILLPFTFGMDPYAALAMLLGLSAVTVTSDTIPAVLFSVPGTVGSAATILDGYPMARKGEAGRAFGAAFSASVIGGLFGAALLGVSIPVLRPLVLLVGSPELLAICIFGLSLVASLSGGVPLKGMAAAAIGMLVAMAGEDPQTAVLRWTFDSAYLWDGMPIVPFALGLFAVPEIADLAISRRRISGEGGVAPGLQQLVGIRDTLRHWWLVLRCAAIGSTLGAIPGMGAAVIDWIAYGHAARTERGAGETFGTGDVRGVIASESSNNAKEGGALIPTIAFGVPGSVSMALILGALLIHDIVPGPDLLTKRLDVTYTLVWSVAVANIFGAGICFLFANQLAKIVLIRIGILAPVILAVVSIGVFQASNVWGDWYALAGFSVLGWVMKRVNWPRPPMILGFVLGGLIEGYMFISVNRYGFAWLGHPLVVILLALTLFGLLRPTIRALWRSRRRVAEAPQMSLGLPAPAERRDTVFTALVIVFFAAALISSAQWQFAAKLMPWTIAWAGAAFAAFHLIGRFVRTAEPEAPGAQPSGGEEGAGDLLADLPVPVMLQRAVVFFLWCAVFLALIAVIGLLPAMFVFMVAYMRFQGRESWRLTFLIAVPTLLFCYGLFHLVVHVIWPHSLLGDWFPVIRSIQDLAFV